MTLNVNILDEIKYFIESEIDELEFAVLFGSHALKNGNLTADIDFKIFIKSEASDVLRSHVAVFAKQINQKNSGISILLPKDVPYEIKTVINKSTLENALNLKAFLNQNGKFNIPEISFSPEFLLSEECQMRTVLSSLTTPNILIAGSFDLFSFAQARAFKSIKSLICNVYNIDVNDSRQILQRLFESPDGRCYKNYLGYKNNQEIRLHFLQHLFD